MIVTELAPGVTLSLAVPPDSREEPASSLPAIDVSAVPGARVVLLRGFASQTTTVRAACVVAPSDRWAPGIEELVLGRATWIATTTLGADVERWEQGAITTVEHRFEQRVIGRAGDREVATIRHMLGFVGADHDALLCSVACSGSTCETPVETAEMKGALVEAPPPSLLVRTVLLAAERPYEAALAALVVGCIGVALLLAKRPRTGHRRYFP